MANVQARRAAVDQDTTVDAPITLASINKKLQELESQVHFNYATSGTIEEQLRGTITGTTGNSQSLEPTIAGLAQLDACVERMLVTMRVTNAKLDTVRELTAL